MRPYLEHELQQRAPVVPDKLGRPGRQRRRPAHTQAATQVTKRTAVESCPSDHGWETAQRRDATDGANAQLSVPWRGACKSCTGWKEGQRGNLLCRWAC